MSAPRWRLLIDGPVEGARNMALDRAVQLACEQGSVLPTLRLYGWTRPTVTLGRFQSVDGIDLSAAEELGCDVVRRFTGGRAVLHDDELTYAVVASLEDGVPRGVAASYRHLCAALAEAYRRLGVDASVTERDRAASSSAACYLTTTRADLSLGAMKLSGSAQVWHGDTVMQHGSFTVSRDVGREARIFRLSAEDAEHLAEGSATIEAVTGRRPALREIQDAVVDAFGDVLGIHIEPGELHEQELQAALDLEDRVRVRSGGEDA